MIRAVLIGLAGLAAGLAALIWAAARSDFRFRGCNDMARDDWAGTANCSDAWFAMVAFGGAAIVLGTVASVLVWRGYA